MKKVSLMLFFMALVFGVAAQQETGTATDIEAIKKVIQTSYVEGLQNEGDTVKINLGFHPGFELLIPGPEGQLEKFTLTEWKRKIRAGLESGKLPRKADERISVKFLFVDVTGNAATAKFEFYVGTKLTFVDYQFLYKYADGWKIVSKIFYKF